MDKIELPQMPQGDEQNQIRQIYSYLYQLAESIQSGFTESTEQMVQIVDSQMGAYNELNKDKTSLSSGTVEDLMQKANTLKGMIIKNADNVKKSISRITANLEEDYLAKSDFGDYYKHATNNITVTPTGTTQEFTLAEAVRGIREELGNFDTEFKGYIKSGYLRNDGGIPIYGVAIGKDIVTFREDGKPIYVDSNKVAELTDEALRFYKNNIKLAEFGERTVIGKTGDNEDHIDINDQEKISFKTGTIEHCNISENGLIYYGKYVSSLDEGTFTSIELKNIKDEYDWGYLGHGEIFLRSMLGYVNLQLTPNSIEFNSNVIPHTYLNGESVSSPEILVDDYITFSQWNQQTGSLDRYCKLKFDTTNGLVLTRISDGHVLWKSGIS